MPAASLIADIGGTHARFAVAQNGRFDHLRVLHTAGYPTMQEAAREFIAGLPPDLRLTRAALDVAGPVSGDTASLTNSTWSFSIAAARAELGLTELQVFNDFAATAMGIPHLGPADSVKIGGGERSAYGTIAVIGPGTGLGVGGLVHGADGWVVVPGEGGHSTMPATSREESRILDLLRDRWGHVSAERVLSGQGIRNLYEAVCILSGQPSRELSDHEITAAALAGEDATCEQTVDLFCAMLGTVAGNLAMTLGATGGLFVTGGILPHFTNRFVASGFRERFESKGRLSSYLRSIPSYLVVHPNPALVGLANLR
jgi:glucokinase